MLKKISTIPFKDTPEQAAKLDAVIAECTGDVSMLMHVMQEAQAIYGYLPFEVQEKIANGMNVPLEKVYGVATFYAQFALSPKGKYDISVCLGTACYVKGAQELLDELSAQLQGIKKAGYKLYWLACGNTDFLFDQANELDQALTENGLEHTYYVSEGGHVWANWRLYLNTFAPLLFK